MSRTRDQAFEIIERLGKLDNEAAIAHELHKAGDSFGYDNFFMTGLPTRLDERLEAYALVSG
jgi:hypothetical protein